MIFGFNIDDVLRNTTERIWTFFLREYPDSPLVLDDLNGGDIQGSLGLSDEEYNEFIENYILEIYGSATDQYKNSNKDFNVLVKFLAEFGHECVIVQKESGKVKNATLYFISDRCLDVNHIHFISVDNFWDYCDVLVTANPTHLTLGKKVIKIKRQYNSHIESKTEISEIKDIFNLDLKKI